MTTRRRLAFAIDQSGGNATYQANLAHALADTPGIHATFLGVKIIDEDVWDLIPGIRHNYALAASARCAAALHAAKRRAPALAAAFIHSQSIGLFSIPFMNEVPTLISSDGTPKNYDTFASSLEHRVYSREIEALKHLWTKATIRAARRLLAFSSWVKDSFVNDYGVDPEKVEIIPSGVDVERWSPSPAVAKGPKRKILFTGGNFPRKGGPLLLRWLAQTRKREVELHLVTKDPVAELANVVVHHHMTANSPALIALAQSCDLFVLPTRGDCFPFAAIEAQSVGLPAIASDVGGMREIIADGETGFLCPAADERAFFERIDRLLEDETLRAKMAEAARARAVVRFDAKRNAARVLALMLSLIEG